MRVPTPLLFYFIFLHGCQFFPVIDAVSSSLIHTTSYSSQCVTCSNEKIKKLTTRTISRGGKVRNTASQQVELNEQNSSSNAVANGIKNFVASGLAAACSKTLLQPLDTIKTMQQHARTSIIDGNKALSLGEAAKLVMKRPNGFLELYAGLGVSALGSMPSVGLYFGVYSYSKEKLGPIFKQSFGSVENNDQDQPLFSDDVIRTLTVASSAAIGNLIASFSRVPYEVVKQKLQTGQYSSTFTAMGDMFRQQGFKAFFPMGGVSIQMIRDIPYAVFTLLSYEFLRDHWVNKSIPMNDNSITPNSSVQKPWKDMVAGGLAGGIGSYLTNPMDVIKTRLQTDSELYKGDVWNCAKATFEEGGFNAFLRGSVPRLIHKVPANAVFFVFYEFFRKVLSVEETTC